MLRQSSAHRTHSMESLSCMITHPAFSLQIAAAEATTPALGALPEWNLSDLYPGLDSPELKRNLERADAECVAFETAHKGKLAILAAGENAGRALADVVKRYEAIEDLLGRLMSFASVVYVGNTTDPQRAKFYGTCRSASRRR